MKGIFCFFKNDGAGSVKKRAGSVKNDGQSLKVNVKIKIISSSVNNGRSSVNNGRRMLKVLTPDFFIILVLVECYLEKLRLSSYISLLENNLHLFKSK